MIVSAIVLFLDQAQAGRPVPAFWPFGPGETTAFEGHYFVLPEPVPSLDDVDFDADPVATAEIEALRWPDGHDPFWEGGPADNFAARFTATLVIEAAGSYIFHLTSDDGSRMLLDEVRIIDHDGTHPMTEQSVAIILEAGAHEVEVFYMEQGGSQGLTLDWTGPDTGGVRIPVGLPMPEGSAAPDASASVPAAPADGPAAAAVATATTTEPAPDLAWVETLPETEVAPGCGFAAHFLVPPELVWSLAEIDFAAAPDMTVTVPRLDWPLGVAPFWDGGPADGFAAHFATTLRVETAGSYEFHLVSDDGSALLVDGAPAIVNDGSHPATERTATLELEAGPHRLDVVYFEREGEQQLTFDWSGPDTGGQRQPLAAAAGTADCAPAETSTSALAAPAASAAVPEPATESAGN